MKTPGREMAPSRSWYSAVLTMSEFLTTLEMIVPLE